MGYPVKQASTSRPLIFLLVDSADHITGKTGLAPTVTLSKNGGAFGSPAGAVTEIGNGLYQVAGNATDNATLGVLALHATAAGADPCDEIYQVGTVDPDTDVAQTGDNFDRIGANGAGLTALGDTRLANLDAAVSSRSTYAGGDTAGVTTLLERITGAVLLAGGYTAPDNAGIAAIKAKTDNLPSDPADASDIAAAFAAVPAAVWSAATRTLTAFAFDVTVDTAAIAADVAEALAESGLTVTDFSADALNQLYALGTITVTGGSVPSATKLLLNQGDDYLTADGRQLQFRNPAGSWAPLTGTVVLHLSRTVDSVTTHLTATGTIEQAEGPGQLVYVDLPRATSILLTSTPWTFDLIATDSHGHDETLRCGDAIVRLRRWVA